MQFEIMEGGSKQSSFSLDIRTSIDLLIFSKFRQLKFGKSALKV